MSKSIPLIACFLSFIIIGCYNSSKKNTDSEITGTGTIKYTQIEGGCYYILSGDSIVYEPVNLRDDMKIEELKITFEANKINDMASACMIGEIIELTRIEKI